MDKSVLLKSEKNYFNNPSFDKTILFNYGTNFLNKWFIKNIMYVWDRHIGFLVPSQVKDKRVLEIGCGHGRIVYYCKDLGAREVIGCDISDQPNIRILSRRNIFVYDQEIIANKTVKFIYGDYKQVISNTEKYDLILCFQALHHLNLNEFIDKCKNLLVVGGEVIISDPNGRHFLRKLANNFGRKMNKMSEYENAYDKDEVIREFKKNNFEVQSIYSLNPVSEIYINMIDLIPISYFFKIYLMGLAWFLKYIDIFLENTILKIFPVLGWRYHLVLQKK